MSSYPANPWVVDDDHFPVAGSAEEQRMALLQWAILAPSSHNAQPWRFAVDGTRIHVFADPSRWLRVADADRREFFVSIGCAMENLHVAAAHFGFATETFYAPDLSEESAEASDIFRVATVHVDRKRLASGSRAALFDAITKRKTNHEPFEEHDVAAEDLLALKEQVDEKDIRLWMAEDEDTHAAVQSMTARANAMQFVDREWREELAEWIGKGAFGTPWLFSKIGQLAMTYLDLSDATTAKDRQRIASAPVFAVLVAEEDTPRVHVRAGQVLERIWLAATQRGVQIQPMNQILQIPELKEEVRQLLPDAGMHPQITFRMGYGAPERRRQPRRSVDAVLVAEEAQAASA